eukprot:362120-Chlamydomonas_euryale.AAC.11
MIPAAGFNSWTDNRHTQRVLRMPQHLQQHASECLMTSRECPVPGRTQAWADSVTVPPTHVPCLCEDEAFTVIDKRRAQLCLLHAHIFLLAETPGLMRGPPHAVTPAVHTCSPHAALLPFPPLCNPTFKPQSLKRAAQTMMLKPPLVSDCHAV